MKKLIDTSILHAAVISDHENHKEAREAVESARKGDYDGIVIINSFMELFTSLTNSKRTDPPLSPEEALKVINAYYSFKNIEIVTPNAADYFYALEISGRLGVRKSVIFDCLILVAALNAGATSALTLNVKDFDKLDLMKVEKP